MRKYNRIIFAVVVIFLLICSLAGCSGNSRKTVVLITDENGTEDYISGCVYTALKEEAAAYGFKLVLQTPVNESAYEAAFDKALKEEPSLIVCSQPTLEAYMVISAKNNPDIAYAIIGSQADINMDGDLDVDNAYGIMFSHEQEGFAAGIYAALTSQSGSVGFIGTDEFLSVIRYEVGFRAGVRCINEAMIVNTVFVNEKATADDIAGGLAQLTATGCDTVYTVNMSENMLNEITGKGMTILSKYLDVDKSAAVFAPESNVSLAIKDLCLAVFGENNFSGQVKSYDLTDENAIELKYKNENDPLKTTVERWTAYIQNGSIIVPATRDELKNFSVPVWE